VYQFAIYPNQRFIANHPGRQPLKFVWLKSRRYPAAITFKSYDYLIWHVPVGGLLNWCRLRLSGECLDACIGSVMG